MSTPTRTHCAQCGAPVKKKGMSVCWNCGTPYSFLEEGQEQTPRDQRFDEVEKHAEFASAKERQASSWPALFVLFRPVAVGVVLIALARILRVALLSEDSAGVGAFIVRLLGILLVLAALVFLIVGGYQLWRFWTAPRITRPALVTRRRTVEPGGDLRHAVGKPLLIYLEYRTENRATARAHGSLAKGIQVDDIGLAYVKGEFLLDYKKFGS